uniref:Putative RNA exonuclease NEF-sp n=1 Tax=Aceria tosichella TaxID=561515 RepID=A0A6G1SAE8_9ACAR
MPQVKLLVNDLGLEAEFRLKPKDDVPEEGEIDSDDEDEDDEEDDEGEEDEEGETKDHDANDDSARDRSNKTDGKQTNKTKPEPAADGSKNGDYQAAAETPSKSKRKPCISLFEMQSFLTALILPEPRLSTPPSWCRVIRCLRASNVGIFLLDNVDLDWIEDKAAKFKHGFRFETSPDWIERLTMVPLSRRAQDMTATNDKKPNGRNYEMDLNARPKIGRSSLLLSPIQMLAENYPMPFDDDDIKPLRSKYYAVNDRSPMFGIDCEMCITDRSELTKISIVDEECRVVYNQLVKPDRPITNYLTRYSGITKDMMEHVQTSLEDVQYFMRKTLPRDAIFVGHSLNMDLAAMRIFHPYVIDTSVIYNRSGVRSYKPSLKSLAYEFLGKNIQTSNKLGHDSLEDAITSLELVQLKIVNGLTFGDSVAHEKALGLKYDSKTGITHLHFDKFIERHKVIPISYRRLDTTPGARCMYIHDEESPLEQDVKVSILQLLDKPNSICVVMTNRGECYVKI